MDRAAQLLQQLTRVFGGDAEATVARQLFTYLADHREVTHINLQLVRQMTPGADKGALDHAIIRTLQFLAGDSVRLLSTKFELIDEEELPHDLTDDEARTAITEYVDPLTGEHDPNIKRRLAIYFSPAPDMTNSLFDESRGT